MLVTEQNEILTEDMNTDRLVGNVLRIGQHIPIVDQHGVVTARKVLLVPSMTQEQTHSFRGLERRRMIQIKNALAAGLESNEEPVFISACVDYLAFNIGRFIAQGEGNLRRLAAAVPDDDEEGRGILDDIATTLEQTASALRCMVIENVDGEGSRLAAQAFVEHYNGTLVERKDPAQYIIRKYFSKDEYWQATDDVTPAVMEREADLYRRLVETSPAVAELDRT